MEPTVDFLLLSFIFFCLDVYTLERYSFYNKEPDIWRSRQRIEDRSSQKSEDDVCYTMSFAIPTRDSGWLLSGLVASFASSGSCNRRSK